jgi:phosphoglycerate dehydrogenase-like enzyme
MEAILAGVARVEYLKDLDAQRRAACLQSARVVLSWAPHQELSPSEEQQLNKIALLQLLSAGADHLIFARLPANLTVASNPGAYARPMAEHVLAMVLALEKRLFYHHEQLRRGVFDQMSENKALSGATAVILGFGGIGKEVARLFKAFDMHILAINRSGRSPEPVEFMGTLAALPQVLPRADILVVALPLNRATRGLLGYREFKQMKPDAVLVNVGRGEIIDEEAFYRHLRETPTFLAGIDAWWTEPVRHGRFEMKHAFLDLPNVLGTPHNSALAPGSLIAGVQQATENIRRFLLGEPLAGRVNPEDFA